MFPLLCPPLIYVSNLIETPTEAKRETNDIIQNFIWEGKSAKIAQNTLIKNIELGGLKLCHYPTKVKALKLSWVKRFCNEQYTNWKVLPKLFLNCDNLNLYFSSTKVKVPKLSWVKRFCNEQDTN